MSGLHNQCCIKDYLIVAKIFVDNYLEVEYLDENNKESGDSVFSGMQLKRENTEIKDANLMEGWQPCDDLESVKEFEWSDSGIDPPQV
jgi:hypothetical protein